ncbi:MAG TPA: S-layer homology domain-containing protein [Chloroflexia bacterium]|nr:S-layer homology domain-containing protein [Chloroflexia bacterium]
MSKKGKIGLSLFALTVLMVIIGIAASGTLSGKTAANAPSGPAANAPAGAANASYVAEGIWAQKPQEKTLPNGVRVVQEVKHDTSPPLRDIPAGPPIAKGEEAENENPDPFPVPEGNVKDTMVQRVFGALAMPTPILTFEGISVTTSGCGCLPPDTNGDVGPNHYVQTVNSAYQIWDKSGTSLQSARNINTIFTGFGGPCEARNDGDPIVLYDSMADRWFINQFTSGAPYTQCTAVSTSPDPLGSYNRYAFLTSATDFYDYQKYGVWPDGYYMTANVFEADGGFHPSAAVFDRAQMLAGNSATFQEFNPGDFYGNLLPSDFDGTIAPPAGAPNVFITGSNTQDRLRVWEFHVDWATPANSSLTGPTDLPISPVDLNLCGGSRNCIPQPGTTRRVDSIGNRVMYKFAYRNLGTHESWVVSQPVDADGTDHAAPRWYELRDLYTTPSVYQQSTYAPDANHRWMSSMAMDKDGNIAIGYSISNATDIFPSIRYAGRLATDPLNELSQGEAVLQVGTGSQTSSTSRWGDYSSMSIDPTDDCTFWYTQEYYTTISGNAWKTRVGSFKFPSCGGPPAPTATPGGPTATATSLPTSTALPTATACANYTFTTGTDTIVTGDTDTTIHCDDCAALVTLPFPVRIYERTFTSAQISSNGVIEFASADFAYGNTCLPVPIYEYTVSVYWDDLLTSAAGDGVFTSVSGSAPNRIWNVDFRTQVLNNNNQAADFEARFYEADGQIDLIYGTILNGTSDYTIGIQRDMGAFTQIACGADPILPGTKYTLTQPCGAITPTPVSATNTVGPTNTVPPTNTVGPTNTPGGPTNTPGPEPTACPIQYQDVLPGDEFYPYIRCLACRKIANGYACGGPGEPCDGDNTGYFRPGNDITRSQIAKMVSIAAGFGEDPGPQIFADVLPSNIFYPYIQRLTMRGHMSGYPCGGPGEPCDSQNRPYFHPYSNATRGQLSKIVANAAGINTPVPSGTQTFEDVPESNTFWVYIERLTALGVMTGYLCGTTEVEPCVPPENRPYFRPYADVTRAQGSKIISNTFFPNCQTPQR